jgi:hypothetical protein
MTMDECKERWRRLASLLHPDKGGDATLFAEAKGEYERRRAQIERGRQTRADGGLGLMETLGEILQTPATQRLIADGVGRLIDPQVRKFLGDIFTAAR